MPGSKTVFRIGTTMSLDGAMSLENCFTGSGMLSKPFFTALKPYLKPLVAAILARSRVDGVFCAVS